MWSKWRKVFCILPVFLVLLSLFGFSGITASADTSQTLVPVFGTTIVYNSNNTEVQYSNLKSFESDPVIYNNDVNMAMNALEYRLAYKISLTAGVEYTFSFYGMTGIGFFNGGLAGGQWTSKATFTSNVNQSSNTVGAIVNYAYTYTSKNGQWKGYLYTYSFIPEVDGSYTMETGFMYQTANGGNYTGHMYIGQTGLVVRSNQSPADEEKYPSFDDEKNELDNAHQQEQELLGNQRENLDIATNMLTAVPTYLARFASNFGAVSMLVTKCINSVDEFGVITSFSLALGVLVSLLGMTSLVAMVINRNRDVEAHSVSRITVNGKSKVVRTDSYSTRRRR